MRTREPYNANEPHPLAKDVATLEKIEQAVRPVASRWAHPGAFKVQSIWQVTPDLRVATGYFEELGNPALIALPMTGELQYISLLKSGGGPAFIKGVKDNLVLIQQGNGYQVYNYRTTKVERSDEHATPGKAVRPIR